LFHTRPQRGFRWPAGGRSRGPLERRTEMIGANECRNRMANHMLAVSVYQGYASREAKYTSDSGTVSSPYRLIEKFSEAHNWNAG
jgi:hypothetical protein